MTNAAARQRKTTTPGVLTPEQRDTLDRQAREALTALQAADLAAVEANRTIAAERQERSRQVYLARVAEQVSREDLALQAVTDARAAMEATLASQPWARSIANYLSASLNLQAIRRENDQAFTQTHPDFGPPQAPLYPPQAPNPIEEISTIIATAGMHLADHADATRRKMAADYVEGRLETFDVQAGILPPVDLAPLLPEVQGGLVPTPDTRTPDEIAVARGQRLVDPSVDGMDHLEGSRLPDPTPHRRTRPFGG